MQCQQLFKVSEFKQINKLNKFLSQFFRLRDTQLVKLIVHVFNEKNQRPENSLRSWLLRFKLSIWYYNAIGTESNILYCFVPFANSSDHGVNGIYYIYVPITCILIYFKEGACLIVEGPPVMLDHVMRYHVIVSPLSPPLIQSQLISCCLQFIYIYILLRF